MQAKRFAVARQMCDRRTFAIETYEELKAWDASRAGWSFAQVRRHLSSTEDRRGESDGLSHFPRPPAGTRAPHRLSWHQHVARYRRPYLLRSAHWSVSSGNVGHTNIGSPIRYHFPPRHSFQPSDVQPLAGGMEVLRLHAVGAVPLVALAERIADHGIATVRDDEIGDTLLQ
jgi:hypothetical protein